MADTVLQHNIGAYALEATSVEPQSTGSATINGGGIDRQAHSMALSCVLHTVTGALTGSPGTASVISKIQDSADGTTFADFLYDGTNVATDAAITAANTDHNYSVDLALARRYVRVVTTVALVTYTAVLVQAGLILGGEQTVAAV